MTELPPLEPFKALPRRQKIDILVNYDPPLREHPGPSLPPLDEFEALPPEEASRIYQEYIDKLPRDEHMEACFRTLPYEDQYQVYMETLKKWPGDRPRHYWPETRTPNDEKRTMSTAPGRLDRAECRPWIGRRKAARPCLRTGEGRSRPCPGRPG